MKHGKWYIFQPFPTSRNGFRIGMRLEGVDPKHQSLFCVLSVAEVQGFRSDSFLSSPCLCRSATKTDLIRWAKCSPYIFLILTVFTPEMQILVVICTDFVLHHSGVSAFAKSTSIFISTS